jgi:hypothetical protein
MSGKPDDIPEDVWRAAMKCAGTVCRNLPDDYGDLTIEVEAIARAILAERNRCFKALLNTPEYNGRKNLVFRTDALDAIRKGTQP